MAGRHLPRFLTHVAQLGALPTDSENERVRKATFVLSVALTIGFGLVWAAAFAALGYRLPASVPLVYSVIASVSLALFVRTRRYRLFRTIHLFLMLILPFVFQLSMGGFVPSGAMIVWSFMAPVGALVLAGTKRASAWLVAFLALVGVAGALDPRLSGPEVPANMASVFFFVNISALATLIYLVLRYFMRGLDETRSALEEEQARSRRLLLNVLPEPIARRLMQGEESIADDCPDVTVLFADLVDFTSMAARMAPDETVDLLNGIFSAFDEAADRLGLEKIKTVGDAYMAVAGIPTWREDHAEAALELALQMRDIAHSRGLEIRVGIDSGPVVAGVIGRNKFSYDLWGETVNTASRMESHGLPGEIQVTSRVYDRLRGTHRFRSRGDIQIKGIGRMEPYLLADGSEAALPEASPPTAI